jgi:hypothetical protein
MANIDINNDQNLGAEDLEQVKGGALLLPAVQKVREAATTTSDTLTAPPGGAPIVKK